MKKVLLPALSLLFILATAQAWAIEESLSNYPGFFDYSSLEEFAAGGKSVDVLVQEPLLSFAVGTLKEKDSRLADMLSKIKAVSVRVFSIEDKDSPRIKARVEKLDARLIRDDWQRVVRVKEDDERVMVYTKMRGNVIEGLAVMAIEYGDEAAFVNIIGEIDPEMLGSLTKHMHGIELDSLDEILEGIEIEKD